MDKLRRTAIRTGLETLYFSGVHHALRPLCSGRGAILTLHHVRPPRFERFQPNKLLEVTPGFLEDVIVRLRRDGVEFLSLDEMVTRLDTEYAGPRFVCLTFDDGYRDNLEWAYPILRRHSVPFTLYIPTSFPDRIGELWWLALEAAVAENEHIDAWIGGRAYSLPSTDFAQKTRAYETLYWAVRSLPTEAELRSAIHDLAARYRIDLPAFCTNLCMTWDEIAHLAKDPLVTIGAHTVNHVMLRKVPEAAVRAEMQMGAAVIEAAIGVRPRHFSYPVGDVTAAAEREFRIAREVGFTTAVTTRPGVLFPEHRDHLLALPRLSLNGEFQRLRYVDVLLSGAPIALKNRFRRVDAA